MPQLLLSIIKWLLKKLWVFLVILLALALAKLAYDQWKSLESDLQGRQPELQEILNKNAEALGYSEGYQIKPDELADLINRLPEALDRLIEKAKLDLEEKEKQRDFWDEWCKIPFVFKTEDEKQYERAKAYYDGLVQAKGTVEGLRATLSWIQGFIFTVKAQIPMALWILAGLVITPLGIKVFMFFVLAPHAQKLKPVQILPTASNLMPKVTPSAVSLSFDVPSTEELLVRPGFLQSCTQPSTKVTQWLLNHRIPLTSLASGMFLLTRVQAKQDSSTRVVVSSQKDPLGEVAAIDIPAGLAMIVSPRAMAGVVKCAATPVNITSHWRIGSLHAWLTLQLRYLAFHGPCTVILMGCRGVRAEEPEEDKPRMINQSATIGFSSNLGYSSTRCETFMSYLLGQEDLFNDLFSGGPGLFIYEEMPAQSSKTGLTGKGLEGLLDAALKVFGV